MLLALPIYWGVSSRKMTALASDNVIPAMHMTTRACEIVCRRFCILFLSSATAIVGHSIYLLLLHFIVLRCQESQPFVCHYYKIMQSYSFFFTYKSKT